MSFTLGATLFLLFSIYGLCYGRKFFFYTYLFWVDEIKRNFFEDFILYRKKMYQSQGEKGRLTLFPTLCFIFLNKK